MRENKRSYYTNRWINQSLSNKNIKLENETIVLVLDDFLSEKNPFEFDENQTVIKSFDKLEEYLLSKKYSISAINIIVNSGSYSIENNVDIVQKYIEDLVIAIKNILRYKNIKVRIFFPYEQNKKQIPINQIFTVINKSIKLLNGNLYVKAIGIDKKNKDDFSKIILAEVSQKDDETNNVIYNNGTRYVETIETIDSISYRADKLSKYGEKQTIIIIGALGGIGRAITENFLNTYKFNLVLIGRRDLNKNIKAYFEKLNRLQRRAEYIKCDISNEIEIKNMFDFIKENYENVVGIINAAGVIDKKTILDKSSKDIVKTFDSKIKGTILLDLYSQGLNLDFFINFSSLAAFEGDFGQVDYSIANRFVNVFSHYRNLMVKENLSKGKTIAISWPLWKSGGMHFDEAGELLYLKTNGLDYLETKDGIELLKEIINCEQDISSVIIYKKNSENANLVVSKGSEKMNSSIEKNINDESIVKEVKTLISSIVGIQEEKIELDMNFSEMGFDSISLKDFACRISESFNIELLPINFFSSPNLDTLTTSIMKMLDIEKDIEEEFKEVDNLIERNPIDIDEEYSDFESEFFDLESIDEGTSLNLEDQSIIGKEIEELKYEFSKIEKSEEYLPIAIIGVEGEFPKAKDKLEFFENILQGKSCIQEVPSERVGVNKGFNSNICDDYHIRGGFIDNIGEFDGEFFNLTPKSCEYMDPQQRKFIEVVWRTIEDAGYKASSLKGKSIGVFTGIQHGDYKELLLNKGICDSAVPLGNEASMISNRISYMFDFMGPSESINTACSSSLVAIHRAIKSIQCGECEMAIAGGVSLYLSEKSFAIANNLGILSQDGECKAFDDDANGYVKGEGIAAILLKPLYKAIKDNDNIYGVIKGSYVNHGGKAQSVTSPNENAQVDLLKETYRIANILPETITLAELHGTGTKLGDPIEVSALKKVYKEYNDNKKMHCALGSVKNNVGHLEPASGIIGLIKVLLSMKHKMIPPVVNFNKVNRYLDIVDSPFYINTEAVKWENIINEGKEIPLRGTVSSFGFGGSNCHMIIEEFKTTEGVYNICNDNVFIISAKSKSRLKSKLLYFKDMLHNLKNSNLPNINECLMRIAYTLQLGREEYKERVAIVFNNLDELLISIDQLMENNKTTDKIYISDVNDTGNEFQEFLADKLGKEYISMVIRDNNYGKLAFLWAHGVSISWERLYKNSGLKKISMQGEIFEKKYYWYDSFKESEERFECNEEKEIKKEIINEMEVIDMNKNNEVVSLSYINDEIGILKLCDRNNKNMFTQELVNGIKEKLDLVNLNTKIKALVVTGYEKFFCMGGTKDELMELSSGTTDFGKIPVIYKGFLELNVPVITAMEGCAFGGGLAFGLYGDIVIMAEESLYSANFMKYGFTPGLGSTYILKEKLGCNISNEMLFTAKVFNGEELKERNAPIIFKKKEDVLTEAISIAKNIANKPKYAIEILKKQLSSKHLKILESIINEELEMHKKTMTKAEVKEMVGKYFLCDDHKEKTVKKLNVKKFNDEFKSEKVINLSALNRKESSNYKTKEETSERTSEKLVLSERKVKANNINSVSKLNLENASNKTLINNITNIIAKTLHVNAKELDTNTAFKDLGIDSIGTVEIIRQINKTFNTNIDAVELYDYNDINKLTEFIAKSTTETDINIEYPTKQLKALKEGISNEVSDNSIELDLQEIMSKVLHVQKDDISNDMSLKDLGIDSINLVEIVRVINKKYCVSIDAIELYDYNNIIKLAGYLKSTLTNNKNELKPSLKESKKNNDDEIMKLLSSIDEDSDINVLDNLLEELI